MNLKENKGVTGTDISVALVIIVLFVGVISSLVYNFGMASKGVNRKAEATNIAITKIEQLKQTEYDNLTNSIEYRDVNGQVATTGPYKVTTTVTRYIDSDFVQGLSSQERSRLQDVIKIVKVSVEYSVGTRNEVIDISTVITKEK